MNDKHGILTLQEVELLKLKYSIANKKLDGPIRVYVDVDGVVSPYVDSLEELERRFPSAVDISVIPNGGFFLNNENILRTGKFWWNVNAVARLAKLSHALHLDVVWLTAWGLNGPYILDKILGIKSSGYLEWTQKSGDYSQFFKRQAIIEDQKKNPSKFVWIEDLANKAELNSPHVFSEEIKTSRWEIPDENNSDLDIVDGYQIIIPQDRFLSITPESYDGLNLDHLEEIENWIARNV